MVNVTVLDFYVKFILCPRWGKLVHFWARIQHFPTFFQIGSLDFSEIT